MGDYPFKKDTGNTGRISERPPKPDQTEGGGEEEKSRLFGRGDYRGPLQGGALSLQNVQ